MEWICKQTTIDDRLDTHLCTIIEDCLRAMVTQGEAVTEGLADMCRQPSKTATQEDQTYMQAEDAVMQAFMQAGMPPHIHAAYWFRAVIVSCKHHVLVTENATVARI